jgi:hypothetical protein
MRIGTSRLVALSALAVLLGQGVASALVVAAYGFDADLLLADGALVERGLGTAHLLRWGGLIDMLGYLALIPVVVYMYGLHASRGVATRVVALCGLSFSLVGASGAVVLASAGAWLLETPVANPEALAAARIAFGTLESAVVVGLWGTLELLLLGIWFIAAGRDTQGANRLVGYAALVAGIGCLGYALRTALAGHPPLPIAGPLDIAIIAAIGLLPVWLLWFALRLWRGEPVAAASSGARSVRSAE